MLTMDDLARVRGTCTHLHRIADASATRRARDRLGSDDAIVGVPRLFQIAHDLRLAERLKVKVGRMGWTDNARAEFAELVDLDPLLLEGAKSLPSSLLKAGDGASHLTLRHLSTFFGLPWMERNVASIVDCLAGTDEGARYYALFLMRTALPPASLSPFTAKITARLEDACPQVRRQAALLAERLGVAPNRECEEAEAACVLAAGFL